MTEQEKVDCVKAGLMHSPTDAEIRGWLHGPAGKPLTETEQIALLERELRGSPNEWRLKVLALIRRVPSGCLISYGNLARWANKEYGLDTGPRNTAWLRKKIYGVIGHDTDIPIHRVANDGDTSSSLDHPVTQHINRIKRGEEGSLRSPVWLHK
jgi:alkylated DNA nucleotide flippase Atl1